MTLNGCNGNCSHTLQCWMFCLGRLLGAWEWHTVCYHGTWYLDLLGSNSLGTSVGSHKLRTEHDTVTKLIRIDLSWWVAEGCKSLWLQELGNQVSTSSYIRFLYHRHHLHLHVLESLWDFSCDYHVLVCHRGELSYDITTSFYMALLLSLRLETVYAGSMCNVV